MPCCANVLTPERRGAPLHFEFLGDAPIGLPASRRQNDPRAKHHLLGRRSGTQPLFQTQTLCFRKKDGKTPA
jgi:hypothetical protein